MFADDTLVDREIDLERPLRQLTVSFAPLQDLARGNVQGYLDSEQQRKRLEAPGYLLDLARTRALAVSEAASAVGKKCETKNLVPATMIASAAGSAGSEYDGRQVIELAVLVESYSAIAAVSGGVRVEFRSAIEADLNHLISHLGRYWSRSDLSASDRGPRFPELGYGMGWFTSSALWLGGEPKWQR
jgi:hypothetical protein